MFKRYSRDELLKLSNLDHKTTYVNSMICQVLDGYIPTDYEADLIKGYAAAYLNCTSAMASVKVLRRILRYVEMMVSGSDKKDSDSGLLKV